MNKKRMLELADHIEKLHPSRFDMLSWFTKFRRDSRGRKIHNSERYVADNISRSFARKMPDTCNTAGCIAGWAIALHPSAGRDGIREGRDYSPSDHAAAILDLDRSDAHSLFERGMTMKPKQAARRIREAVELGYVPESSKHLREN